ncbi:MAG: hypothetical protein EBT22_12775, partial [Chloroflexi bacterium]|nr:hypothetical protein [Chloroflexota bacterium]
LAVVGPVYRADDHHRHDGTECADRCRADDRHRHGHLHLGRDHQRDLGVRDGHRRGGYAATTSLALNGGTIRDAAGNDATRTLASPGASGSLGNAKAIIIDTTAPTVTSITRVNSQLTKDPPVFTVTFSESVSGVVAANFAASKGSGISGTGSVSVSGSGNTWTVTVSGLTGDYGTNTNATVGLTVVPGTSISDTAPATTARTPTRRLA